jgi:hypothetical protein
VIAISNHNANLNQDTKRRLRSDGMPTSSHRARLWALSMSSRVGAVKSCRKKFDEVRTAVDMMLIKRWSIRTLRLDWVQLPRYNVVSVKEPTAENDTRKRMSKTSVNVQIKTKNIAPVLRHPFKTSLKSNMPPSLRRQSSQQGNGKDVPAWGALAVSLQEKAIFKSLLLLPASQRSQKQKSEWLMKDGVGS